MPRNPRFKDWPECLKRMTLDQLRSERSYWQSSQSWLRHPQARKTAAKYEREVQKEIDSRDEEN